MLMSVPGVLVKNPVKESFYEKRKKKIINILTIFFIFQKSNVNWIFNQYSNDTCEHFHNSFRMK